MQIKRTMRKQRLFREMKPSQIIMNILKYIKEAIYSIQGAIKTDIQGTHKNS